ncbi:MAG: hypothetical protein ACE5KM_00595 [Planctomycetaceae bacterium]
MATGFAGSRSLDERRRRRIAGNQGPAPSDESTPIDRPQVAGDPSRSFSPRSRRRLPLRRIISPGIWKHAGIALLLALCCAARVWAGCEYERIGENLGADAREFFELSNRRLTAFLGGMLLVGAAQLSLLIWWVRSHSRSDFSGRYRIWRWAAPVGFFAAACAFIDLHVLWGRTVVWCLDLSFPNAEVLCWVAPLIGCGCVLFRDIATDMRRCRTSSTLLRAAVVGWSVSIGLLLNVGESIGPALREVVVVSAALAGHYCLFTGLLVHARYVIFVSAEPPQPRPSLAGRLWGRIAAARAARKQKRRRHDPKADAGETSKPAGDPRSVTAVTPTASEPGPEDSSGDSRKSRMSKKNSAGRTVRIDEPHSTQDLGNLSKKERRRRRKRQRARQTRGGTP